MTTPPLGRCMFCGEEVAAGPAAFPLIGGFELTRYGGGANQIVGSEREPWKVAHIHCAREEVRKRRAGIAVGQQGLEV
jgi:hypothetical protein